MLLLLEIVPLFLFYIFPWNMQKIDQKNTWELGLIDHLYEIIKFKGESDAKTNFQKVNADSFYDLTSSKINMLWWLLHIKDVA